MLTRSNVRQSYGDILLRSLALHSPSLGFSRWAQKDGTANLIYFGSALRAAHPGKMSDRGWPVVFVLRVWPQGGELIQEIDS